MVTLTLPMPVRRVLAHENVAADRGRMAIQRGPIVYALEWPDNPGGGIRNVVIPDDAAFTSEFRPTLLGGVQVVKTQGVSLAANAAGQTERQARALTAISLVVLAAWLLNVGTRGR